MHDMVVFPIPIRPDVIVRVHIPHDLTKKEAEQISRVVMALAVTTAELKSHENV